MSVDPYGIAPPEDEWLSIWGFATKEEFDRWWNSEVTPVELFGDEDDPELKTNEGDVRSSEMLGGAGCGVTVA